MPEVRLTAPSGGALRQAALACLMRVTPLNIVRFWRKLMFPPETYHSGVLRREGDDPVADYSKFRFRNRSTLSSDLPWEPWLHATVWVAVFLTLVFGEVNLFPPGDFADWVWVACALFFPPLGFFSVWMMEYGAGKIRYIAIWQRMVADAGLAAAILAYLANRLHHGLLVSGQFSIMADCVLFSSAWFTLTLVKRDIKFIIATERLANLIFREQVLAKKVRDRAERGRS